MNMEAASVQDKAELLGSTEDRLKVNKEKPAAVENYARLLTRFPGLVEGETVLVPNAAFIVFDIEASTEIQAKSPELAREMTYFAQDFYELILSKCNSSSIYAGTFYGLKTAGDEVSIMQEFTNGTPLSTIDALILLLEVQQIYTSLFEEMVEIIDTDDQLNQGVKKEKKYEYKYKGLREYYIKKNSTSEVPLKPPHDLISTIKPGLFIPAINDPSHLAIKILNSDKPEKAELLVTGEATIAKTLSQSWRDDRSSVGTIGPDNVLRYLTLSAFVSNYFEHTGYVFPDAAPTTLIELQNMTDQLIRIRRKLVPDEVNLPAANLTKPKLNLTEDTESNPILETWLGAINREGDKKPSTAFNIEEDTQEQPNPARIELARALAGEQGSNEKVIKIDNAAVSYINIAGIESVRREIENILMNKIDKNTRDIIIAEVINEFLGDIYNGIKVKFEEGGWRLKESEYIEKHEDTEDEDIVPTIAATNGNFVILAIKGDDPSANFSLDEKDRKLIEGVVETVNEKKTNLYSTVNKAIAKQGLSIKTQKSKRKEQLYVTAGVVATDQDLNMTMQWLSPQRIGGTIISAAARLAVMNSSPFNTDYDEEATIQQLQEPAKMPSIIGRLVIFDAQASRFGISTNEGGLENKLLKGISGNTTQRVIPIYSSGAK